MPYKDKEKQLEAMKKWCRTDAGQKSVIKANWKRIGLKSNLDEIWEIYQEEKNCWICGVEFTKNKKRNKQTKVMDHDHKTGEFRMILCNSCNVSERNVL